MISGSLTASFAAVSASSLPRMPVCPGIQISFSFADLVIRLSRILAMIGVLLFMFLTDSITDKLSVQMSVLLVVVSVALRIAWASAVSTDEYSGRSPLEMVLPLSSTTANAVPT